MGGGDEQVMDGCAGVAGVGRGFVVGGGVGVDWGVFVGVGDGEGVAVCFDLVMLVDGVNKSWCPHVEASFWMYLEGEVLDGGLDERWILGGWRGEKGFDVGCIWYVKSHGCLSADLCV